MKATRIFAAAKKQNQLELLMYDQIGGGFFSDGITAKDVKSQLDAAGDVTRIVVRINSPGGSVFEGVAIYNLLKQHGAPIDVYVDGVAASIASVIAMAGTTVTMGEGAMLMIHNAFTGTVGNAKDLRKTADLLDKVDVTTITPAYLNRSNKSAEDLAAMMADETWLSAQEAVEMGFADNVVEMPKDKAAAARAIAQSFELTAQFTKLPEALKPTAGNNDCTCDCGPCMARDCAACTHENCDCEGCQCAEALEDRSTTTDVDASAAIETDRLAASRRRRARLAELS